MKNNRGKLFSPLGKHLLIFVIIKILILYGLWYTLIRPYKVKVDIPDISRLYGVQPDEPSQKEQNYDRR